MYFGIYIQTRNMLTPTGHTASMLVPKTLDGVLTIILYVIESDFSPVPSVIIPF